MTLIDPGTAANAEVIAANGDLATNGFEMQNVFEALASSGLLVVAMTGNTESCGNFNEAAMIVEKNSRNVLTSLDQNAEFLQHGLRVNPRLMDGTRLVLREGSWAEMGDDIAAFLTNGEESSKGKRKPSVLSTWKRAPSATMRSRLTAPASTSARRVFSFITRRFLEKIHLLGDRNARGLAMTADQQLDQVRHTAVLAQRRHPRRFLQRRVDPQVEGAGFLRGHGIERAGVCTQCNADVALL